MGGQVEKLREHEAELDSLLAQECDKSTELSQEVTAVESRELCALNDKIAVDAELTEVKIEMEANELDANKVETSLKKQVEDVQAELEKLRDENMQLQQDKLVSERAKVRANKKGARSKFAAAAHTMSSVPQDSVSPNSTSVSPKHLGDSSDDLLRDRAAGEAPQRRLPDAFMTGKRQLAHHARQASQGSLVDELSP